VELRPLLVVDVDPVASLGPFPLGGGIDVHELL
jgi:hypothetical protein